MLPVNSHNLENIFQALNEAVDALGDIPAESASKQQQEAYKLCTEERDRLDNEREGLSVYKR